MRELLARRAVLLDRAVCLLLVALNAVVIAKIQLRAETIIGALNGSLAAALLAASMWAPDRYANQRLLPIVLLRLLVCALPLVSDTIGPFGKQSLGASGTPGAVWQLSRGAFMLLVGISWSVGLFIATFLLLPPAQHLAVHALSFAMLLPNNGPICRHFLDQHPANAAVIQAVDAGMRAMVIAAAPVAQQELGYLGGHGSTQASCMAGATAMQVAFGLVLPTMLAWQLQSGMAASIAAYAAAVRDSEMAAEVERSQHARLCTAVARNTQGCITKLLLTGCSMLLTYVVSVLVLDR